MRLAILTFVAGIALTAAENWIMPSTFGYTSAADFWWPIQGGVNLVSMFVRSAQDPGRYSELPLGPCALVNIEKQICQQYVNNGTAQFGGVYAKGLIPGQKYFISILWITENSTQAGIENSPVFTMEYPNDPNLVSAANGTVPAQNDSNMAHKVSAVSTKTIQLSLAPTSSAHETGNSGPSQPPNLNATSQEDPGKDSTMDSSTIGKIVAICIAGAGLFCAVVYAIWWYYTHTRFTARERAYYASQGLDLTTALALMKKDRLSGAARTDPPPAAENQTSLSELDAITPAPPVAGNPINERVIRNP